MANPLKNSTLAWVCAMGIAATSWLLPQLAAQGSRDTAKEDGQDASEVPARVYFKAPVSAEAAMTWIKLERKAPMKFDTVTLEDFIKKVQTLTVDKDNPEGVMVYVDPVGLSEVEKTMSSPISLNLANVKIKTALELGLDQLQLRFLVSTDGIVRITNRDGKLNVHEEPIEAMLDRIEALRDEVRQLRAAIGARK